MDFEEWLLGKLASSESRWDDLVSLSVRSGTPNFYLSQIETLAQSIVIYFECLEKFKIFKEKKGCAI